MNETIENLLEDLKNHDFAAHPFFMMKEGEAQELVKVLTRKKRNDENRSKRNKEYYQLNKEKLNARALARYHAKKGEVSK